MKDVEAQLIHDMQNTATVLREAASQLHDYESLPPVVVEHLTEMISRRSDMLVRLLSDLSTSHLAGRGELDLSLQRVSLAEVCRGLVEERQPAGDVRITVDVADDAVAVGDPMRVTQVLDNLVTNALRYGGPNIHVSGVRRGSSVRLTVSDDGPGVPEELLDHLFQAYVRGATSHSLGGSGLGMLIVRQLCEAMGGAIVYDGSQGARFTATLPAVPVPRMLGPDIAEGTHAVTFWHDEERLTRGVATFVANGLAAGEAVLVSVTPDHQALLEAHLAVVGVDLAAVSATGQYVPLDASGIRDHLPRLHHIDRDRFDAVVGATVDEVYGRWQGLRVYGEIVDLYWRRGDQHLALELESCWNDLRARVPFRLLCGYQLAPGESGGSICDHHDTVLSA